ncbi:hypothetical protein PPERSA_10849 [Pseudocohnilembus persalinus]|uniref:Actin family n=1 Tax=Pseudocohnilembus persalinus TaxID=266149 RepID=A0A0V0QDS0_PSEPJ|nr:hypothetical protein PPERSA_10849 [Pseudocohnilembus persalinus]|eukprot:KRX00350.1 hypothetical protein PPERSA_10849 [Pseudocohnilembus persalinus]
MADDIVPAIVIDNGSGFCKAGIAGDDAPRSQVPTVIGRPKQPGLMVGMDQKDTYVGNEVESKHEVLNLSYPIDNGEIQNWDDMEKIWDHIFHHELHVNPEDHPVLLTEAPNNKKKNREQMIKLMFEKYNVNSFFLATQQVLALFATGNTTGIVVDSGYASTHTVPIYEGFALSHAIQKTPLAGRDLTDYLIKLYEEGGSKGDDPQQRRKFSTMPEANWVNANDTKEKKCYIVSDYESEIKQQEGGGKEDVLHVLPDGNKIYMGTELFKCPEALFTPLKLGKDYQGIHESTFQSIMKCEVDIRKDLYGNIVLAGGTTMFKGLKDRLKKEVAALAPSTMLIDVKDPPERKYNIRILK